DPFTDEPYGRDPRTIAARAEAYLASTGFAATLYFAPEAAFYLFHDIPFSTSAQSSFYHIDSVEAAWNTGSEEERRNLAHPTRVKGGYYPLSPSARFADLRDPMVLTHKQTGLEVERAHHEVGTAGQQ